MANLDRARPGGPAYSWPMPGRVTNFANIVSLLGAFLATSVVLGLLGAGLVMPAVGATGATARQGSTSLTPCPATSPRPRCPSSPASWPATAR